MNFDWQELAFSSKKPLNELKAIFIAPPREMSVKRFTDIVKTYLPKGNIVLGTAKEAYIYGFEGQPQFKTLRQKHVQIIIDKVNKSASKHKIFTLDVQQRDLKYVLEKVKFNHVLLVRGSWQRVFHSTEAFYTLVRRGIPYELISPFFNEIEAKQYAAKHTENLRFKIGPYDQDEMFAIAEDVAELSFDYTFQTGAVVGKKIRNKYLYVTHGFNAVVPYQTYAMHYGNSREDNFSVAQDTNFYDTIHAETALVLAAQKQKLSLKDTTLFINLMPCPHCARMLSQTDIKEVVYTLDHSDGYAVKLLEAAGKTIRRVV